MSSARSPSLWIHCILILWIWIVAIIGASRWPGATFPGFLVLDNGVIASAGLAHWPGTSDGTLFQSEILAVDGRPVESAHALSTEIAQRSEGDPVLYEFRRRDGSRVSATVAVRRFDRRDFLLLFGPYLLTGTAFLILSVLARVLRRDDPLARGIAGFSLVAGLYAVTAMDLYGPHRLFRLHVLSEILMIPGALHIALVFPRRARLLGRSPRLVAFIWLTGFSLGLAGQFTLYDPGLYTVTHQLATGGIGVAMIALIAAQIGAYLGSPSFQVRQRVRVVALAAVAAFLPILLLGLTSLATGGRIHQNLMAFTAVLFPVALGYAALRHDLLEVDALIRRSISYALLTAGIAALYAGIFGAIESLWADSFTRDRQLFSLVLGAVCVGLLLPLRDWIQRSVDRVFFRTRYDYQATLERTSRQLAAVANLATIQEVLQSSLGDALHPDSLSLLVEHDGRYTAVGQGRQDPGLTAGIENGLVEFKDGSLSVPLRTDERVVAVLHLGSRLSGKHYSGQDRSLLLTLAHQAAIAVQNALALEALSELNRTLEQKVQARTMELQVAMNQLRHTQSQLVHGEKMASLGRFVAGIAHELNNPLGFVVGNMHFLQTYTASLTRLLEGYASCSDQLDASSAARMAELRTSLDVDYILSDLPSLFDGCVEGIERAVCLVRDLRTFSRIDQSDLLEIDLHESLESTLNLLRARLALVRVERDYAQLPAVECLAGQLNHVLMNLLVNALDAMGDRGVLTIRTRTSADDRVRIEIEDTGCGMEPEALDHIFEPFYTTKPVGQGTGLGLSITYGIVARHGGSINVRSEPGRGSCFAVELPVHFSGDLTDPDVS